MVMMFQLQAVEDRCGICGGDGTSCPPTEEELRAKAEEDRRRRKKKHNRNKKMVPKDHKKAPRHKEL